MSEADIDEYLTAIPEPERAVLTDVRAALCALLPQARQGIAYVVPCFKIAGKSVAGFGQQESLYVLPDERLDHGGTGRLREFVTSKRSIHFSPDQPLPIDLLERLVIARQQEISRNLPGQADGD